MLDLELLRQLERGPASGNELATRLGQTRSAVWKRIEALRAAGVEIDAQPGRGYALAQALQWLDAPRLRQGLSASAQALLSQLQVELETDSTNADALAATLPARGYAVWLAERQRAGRGRRGRSWQTPLAAQLCLSVAMRCESGVAALGGLPLAVGVLIAECLRAQGYAEVGLKWPNDVLARGRKLGGVLVEIGGDAAGPLRVVVGIGINVAMPAAMREQIGQPWIDLRELAPAPAIDRTALAIALLDALLPGLARFDREGLAPFLSRWRGFDALVGEPVQISNGERQRLGVALGIADDGALRVRHDDGEGRYHGGEVTLRRA